MKLIILVVFATLTVGAFGQSPKVKVPSYFGLQVRPVFPTRFIGSPDLTLTNTDEGKIGVTTTISQKMGYSFGATVRAGLTKLIALETGINFTQRNFDITMEVIDSNVVGSDDLSFINYDIPINALFYIKLSEQWYANASLGVALNYKPTNVGLLNRLTGYHEFRHSGLVRNKFTFDLNANVGFEFRTEKIGFFYLGGSGRVPLAPIFDLLVDYSYQGNENKMYGEVDGSFLSIDVKYFFPNIKNKGPQFQQGPITQ